MTENLKPTSRPSVWQRSISFYKRRPKLVMFGIPFLAMILLYVDAYVNRDEFRNSTVAIIGENIDCRAEPNRNAGVVRQISGYAEFKSRRADGDWVQIETGEQDCWIYATFVVLDAEVKAGEGEQPRMVEYLKNPAADGSLVVVTSTESGRTPPPIRASYPEPCRAVGEGRFASARPDRCGGFWNVFASVPDGYVWYSDKTGTDPAAQRIERQATQLQSSLRRCDIKAERSLSDWFDDFTPGLVVVHSHPHDTRAAANAELARARACGLSGFSKQSLLQIAGRD